MFYDTQALLLRVSSTCFLAFRTLKLDNNYVACIMSVGASFCGKLIFFWGGVQCAKFPPQCAQLEQRNVSHAVAFLTSCNLIRRSKRLSTPFQANWNYDVILTATPILGLVPPTTYQVIRKCNLISFVARFNPPPRSLLLSLLLY